MTTDPRKHQARSPLAVQDRRQEPAPKCSVHTRSEKRSSVTGATSPNPVVGPVTEEPTGIRCALDAGVKVGQEQVMCAVSPTPIAD